jgi:L-ribulokinase
VYADVLNRPISLLESEIGPALGSGIQAAVAAGVYPDIAAASAAMGAKTPAAYTPDPDRAKAYDALYAEYRELYAYFGQGGNEVMHRLRAIRRAARLRAGKQE